MERHITTPVQANSTKIEPITKPVEITDWRNQRADILILVVEDDSVSRHMLKRVLEAEHYRVEEAANGEEALSLYKLHQPTMVLLDAIMPGISGFEVCTQIHALPGGDRTTVIMITGLDDRESVNQAFEAGAPRLFTKPISLPGLLKSIYPPGLTIHADGALLPPQCELRNA